jgi:hypothetical protein
VFLLVFWLSVDGTGRSKRIAVVVREKANIFERGREA